MLTDEEKIDLVQKYYSGPISVTELVAEVLTQQKLDIELAEHSMHKVTDSAKPVSIGSGSGDSPLSFVSMLKAINSRSFSATA